MALASRIAHAVMQKFDQLPAKGKPQPQLNEWTILGAVVAKISPSPGDIDHNESGSANLKVISLATGCKCVAERLKSADGGVLNDSHAEIVAVRALRRYFLWEIRRLLSHTIASVKSGSGTRCLVDGYLLQPITHPVSNSRQSEHSSVADTKLTSTATNTKCPQFELNPAVSLHLYISDTPCGDASIYVVDASGFERQTGAKELICARKPTGNNKCVTISTEGSCAGGGQVTPILQRVGRLRTKSGRSDIPLRNRTTSMSCSDKLALSNVIGVQVNSGFVVSLYLASG